MKAADVMVSNVVTVSPDASVLQLAEILTTHGVSGVPVVDADGHLNGIISEADLLRLIEPDGAAGRPSWLALLMEKSQINGVPVRKVADVMTRNVITASPEASLRDIAELLERNGIKRVPIVSRGKVVGIVSRANLVQAVATVRKEVKAATATSDSMIREEVLSQLRNQSWAETSRLNVIVHDGTVELWGTVRSPAEKKAVRVTVELTTGVRAINDHLIVKPVKSLARCAFVAA